MWVGPRCRPDAGRGGAVVADRRLPVARVKPPAGARRRLSGGRSAPAGPEPVCGYRAVRGSSGRADPCGRWKGSGPRTQPRPARSLRAVMSARRVGPGSLLVAPPRFGLPGRAALSSGFRLLGGPGLPGRSGRPGGSGRPGRSVRRVGRARLGHHRVAPQVTAAASRLPQPARSTAGSPQRHHAGPPPHTHANSPATDTTSAHDAASDPTAADAHARDGTHPFPGNSSAFSCDPAGQQSPAG
jgi:hypothetical protein